MHLTIYFGTKPLFLATEINAEIKPYAEDEGTLVKDRIDRAAIREAINHLQQSESSGALLLHPNLEELYKMVKNEFSVLIAAGGLVLSDNGTVLFIFRRGKWDLPKGKLDEGEELELCAVREVQEETGLQQVRLEKPLCVTYHTYYQNERLFLKESHWYLMSAPEQQAFTPQTDEDISECIWVHPENISTYLENTHSSIVDVVKKAQPLLKSRTQ